MKSSVSYLIENHRAISWIASVACIGFLGSLLVSGVRGISKDIIPIEIFELLIGAFLGAVLVLGFLAMVMSTWVVSSSRRKIHDWGIFLCVIWLCPFLAVSVYLGGLNLVKSLCK